MRSQRVSSKLKAVGRMVNPQQTIFELKHKVLISLNKLSDRDTCQIGVEELEKIAEGLTPERIVPFLSCIIDSDSEQKSAVRKECIRLLGTLARFHGSLMSVHLGKMVGSIMRRLKDSDSAVRDACVETAGILSTSVGNSGGNESMFVALVRPFFEALGEQNRYAQAGSASCLARIIDEACEPPISLLVQMLTRIVKLLKNQHFMSKPAVIELIRSIVQAGGASTEHALSLAVTSIMEALKCNDWTTRKAASVALTGIAVSAGSVLGFLKTSCISSLESCRFDKVKPVRDAVIHALQCWKALPGAVSSESSEAGSPIKEIIEGEYADLCCTSDVGWKDSSFRKTGSASALFATTSSSTKKRTPLSIRKNCPNYIQDYQLKNSKDLHIEISLPKRRTTSSVDDNHIEPKQCNIQREFQTNEDAVRCQDILYECDTMADMQDCSSVSEVISGSCDTKHVAVNHDYLDEGNPANIVSMNTGPINEEVDSGCFRSLELKSVESAVIDIGSHGMLGCCSHAASELALIRKQLLAIETKQSRLLDLLEVFMGNTTVNLSELHLKVHNLEGAVDEIGQIIVHNGYLNMPGFKHLKETQRVSSSPRLSTCIPRPSVDAKYRPHSAPLSRMQLCQEKSLFRSGSSSSAKEGLNLWSDPTVTMVRNPEKMDMKKKVRNQGKDNENLLFVQTSSIGSKQSKCGNRTISWKRINEHMCIGDVESAYEEALYSGDDVNLLELMDTTGPVLEKLSCEAANEVLNTLTRQFLKQRFMSSMLPWLQQVVDLTCTHETKQLFLSRKTQMEFLYALKAMAEVGYIDSEDRISITQFAAKLMKGWSEAPNKRKALPRGPSGINNLVNSARV